ncbi:hypothetical protein F4861DRAFT_202066 [Xylaria intraflava]|nr:hypothetical protein F4861DRAFT_202066 [Xylaria intraflava]
MDEVLNVSSSVTGALSLAIQIAQLTQKHTSRMVNLPHSVTLYIAELVSLKSLLSDVQDAFLLQSTASGPGAAMHQTLATELEDIRAELESLHCKLQDAQSHRALLMVKNLVWPFGDDETVGWANSLNRCKDRVQTTVLVSGLRLQLQTLRELRQLRDKAASAEQDRENRLILDWICDDAWRQKHSELAQAHHPNTGEWILDRPEFRDWVDGNQRTLWCYGARTYYMPRILCRFSLICGRRLL